MTPLPPGFRIVFDRSLRLYRDGHLLLGGTPARAIRLTAAGRESFAALRDGRGTTETARLLARRLVDAGMAHPRPPRATAAFDVTVIVPVRDRPAMLDRCLTALGTSTPVLVVDDGSDDPRATSAIAKRHGATVLRLEQGRGAAAARNAGLAAGESQFVAFVDSDCLPEAGWLGKLADHFADPLVGAVAPRIRPVSPARPRSVLSRFTAARSPLDLGVTEGPVRPGGRIAYVPTAALVVRRQAVGRAFDAELRYGEDVDFVWRLHDAGWRIRYVPKVTVEHEEPASWRGVLGRRLNYGTSAAPLSQRHAGRLSHAVVRPWPTTTAALILAGRPCAAIAANAAHSALLWRRFRGTGISPVRALLWSTSAVAPTIIGVGQAATMLVAPGLLVALCLRATRRPALVLLLASPLDEWARTQPRLDPLRWTASCLADDVAYGVGVWRGCATHRTLDPLVPTMTKPW